MATDNIFLEVGDSGRFQLKSFIILSIGQLMPTFLTFSPIFTAYERNYTCLDLYLNQKNSTNCRCSNKLFNVSIRQTTIQSQYNLVCDRSHLAPMSTTIFMFGVLLGCTIYGIISDKFGRLMALFLCGIHGIIFGMMTPFSSTYILYSCGRFCIGAAVGGAISLLKITNAEYTSQRRRISFSLNLSNSWSMAICLLVPLAYFERRHIPLQIYSALASFLLIFAYFVLPESPRWLLIKQKTEKAYSKFLIIANYNGKHLSKAKFHILAGAKDEEITLHCSEIFSFLTLKHMRKTTVIICFQFLTTTLVYYSLTFSSGKIGGNIYINLFFMSLIEIPARYLAMILVNKFGRLPVLMICNVTGGMFCFISAIFFNFVNLRYFTTGLIITSKIFIGTVFSLMWFYAIEAYPTRIRSTAVGSASTFARIGGILASVVVGIDKLNYSTLPFILYGSLCFISGCATLFLPETKNMPTLETIEDGEEFASFSWLFLLRNPKKKVVLGSAKGFIDNVPEFTIDMNKISEFQS